MKSEISYKKLFNILEEKSPRKNIQDLVLIDINNYKIRIARMYALINVLISTISVVGFIPIIYIWINNSKQSGLFEYLSLITSNGMDVVYSWKSYGLTLIESIPISESITSIALIFLGAYSMKLTSKYFSQVNNIRSLNHQI